MESKKLYSELEKLSNKDIQIGISTSIVYLIKKRGFKKRTILKDIKQLVNIMV